jgi:hypothetical protein
MAFDNTTLTKWLTQSTPTGWIQFQFPNNQRFTVSAYSISSANDFPERDPRQWTLLGSNNESDWSIVDYREDQSWTDRFQRREFACAYPGSYNFYRLDISLNNGSSNLTGFSEMELMEDILIASSPEPANSAEALPFNSLTLSWQGPAEIAEPEYEIYLSSSSDAVNNSDNSAFISQQTENSCVVVGLEPFTTYYWRVDVLGDGSRGNIWQFRTAQPYIGCLSFPADIDGDCEAGLGDLFFLALRWLDSSCADFLCGYADIDESGRVDIADMAILGEGWSETGQSVIISEIMPDNENTLTDNLGEPSDWIEIRNLALTAQNLAGWHLTDDEKAPDKWTFPDVSIEAGGYLIVYASGLNITADPANLHTNFKLGSDGEYLALTKPDFTIAHEFFPSYPSLGNDESYGLTVLQGEDRLVTALLSTPTPGTSNGDARAPGAPVFSVDSGIFDAPVTIAMSLEDPSCDIRYTLDSSEPTAESSLYTAPLNIAASTCVRAASFKEGYLPGKMQTRSYIFPATVASQPAQPENWPAIWKTEIPDYEMDPYIVNHAQYGPLLNASLLSLPSLSIVTEMDNLFDASSGIYSNPLQEGVEWERPASVELLSADGSETFRIDCGLRIQGGAFRGFDLTKKKSFRLLFKTDYGPGKLKFPLFDYAPDATDSFDTITLRAGANDGYSWSSAYATEQYIRDEFGRSTQLASGSPGSHGRFVHLYLNGLYWGLYNAVERPDNAFSATYNGGEKEDWDAINSGDISDGTMDMWNLLIEKCNAGIATAADFEELQGNNPDGSRNLDYPVLIDMAEYIDYMIINMWGGNGDWPWRNYWVARDRTENSEGFKFYCWDYEGTMASPFMEYNKVTADFNSGAGVPHYRMKDNPEYRMLFADRVQKLFFNDGALTSGMTIPRYSALADKVELAIVAESARWADMHYDTPPGLAEWRAKRDEILGTFLPTRSATVLQQIKDAGYYPALNAPEFKLNSVSSTGGYAAAGDLLTINVPGETATASTVLLDQGAPVRVFIPQDDSLALTWTEPSFTPDSLWTDGSTGTGVGYEAGVGYANLIGTDIRSTIYQSTTSAYCRIEFQYSGADAESLTLSMKYDDGFIAYLNGVEVCRTSNITNATPGSASASNHEASATSFEDFDISAYKGLLVEGVNVLAIHGINYSTSSSDMIVLPKLTVTNYLSDDSAPVFYTTDGSDPRLVGGAVNASAIAYAGAFALEESCLIKARAYVNGEWSALMEAVYSVGPLADSLRVTEIMYHPTNDPAMEFIELMNVGTDSVGLNLVRFTKGIDFDFGPMTLASGERVILVQDAAVFSAVYPKNAAKIAGVYEGYLDNSGERIKLVDPLGNVILDFDYKDSWYDMTDGAGFSLTVGSPYTITPELYEDKSFWRPSVIAGGSPATNDDGIVPMPGAVVINEVLAHSDKQEHDWIELYNTTDEPVYIGGWYLSDSDSDEASRKKFRIADGTVINGGAYKLFYENYSFGNPSAAGCLVPFQMSENGEKVCLSAGIGDMLLGYVEVESFGASMKDVAFGRYEKSVGGVNFVAMSENTPGAQNAYPEVGPVIISEVMYHPAGNSDAEYVELMNISDALVTLIDSETGVPWRFVDDKDDIGLELNFPSAIPLTLAAGGKMLLIKDVIAFEQEFLAGADISTLGVQWLEWGAGNGSLSNSDEKPELQMGGDIDETLTRYYIRVDRVSYEDVAPWPAEADGDGLSLTKPAGSLSLYGNDPANWRAATPTPGT